MRFDAPAGTVITGLDFDGSVTATPGWQAGVWDASGVRWLWCGRGCETTNGAWIHQELRGLSTRRVEALVRCAAARCERDVRRAWVSLRAVRVYLADGSAPALGGVRGRLAGGGWLRGVQDVAFDATDNAGIRLGPDRARRADRARPRARLRLHAAGAVPERADERVVRHARLGRRRACAGAVGAGRGGQLGVAVADGAGGQHGAGGAGAGAGGRRRVEPGADADARAAGAARAGRRRSCARA